MDNTAPLVRPPAPTPPDDTAMPLPEGIVVHENATVDLAMCHWLHDEGALDVYRDAQAERARRAIPLALAAAQKARASEFETAMARAIEDGNREGVLQAAIGRAEALAHAEALKWTPPHLRGQGPAAGRLRAHQDSRAELRAWWAVAALEANVVPAALIRAFTREAARVQHLIVRAQDAARALENDLDPRRTKAANTALDGPTALLAQARELVQHPVPAQKPYTPRRKASA